MADFLLVCEAESQQKNSQKPKPSYLRGDNFIPFYNLQMHTHMHTYILICIEPHTGGLPRAVIDRASRPPYSQWQAYICAFSIVVVVVLGIY